MEPIINNLSDIEALARLKLSRSVYDYYAGGSGDEITLKRNREIFNHIQILPRVLHDTTEIDLAIQLFGNRLSMPLIIAPMAFQAMAHPDGEIATTKAASAMGIVATISTMSTFSLEAISSKVESPLWFQLYVYKDRSISVELIKRAEAAGYQALVITVDAPIMARRERDLRNQFKLPEHLAPQNLLGTELSLIYSEGRSASSVKNFTDMMFDRSCTWKDIEWLRSLTKLPILIKGILRTEDAVLALNHGASGIIISNHGGRQLDTLPTGLEVLPGIAKALNGNIPILIDGGFRHGIDIMKALALGADSILLGRPILWGLSIGGQQGVYNVLEILKQELYEAMILGGYTSIIDIKSHADVIVQFATNLATKI